MIEFRIGFAVRRGICVLAQRVGHHVPVQAAQAVAAIDAGTAGVVSYLRSFGEGVILNRGDDSPGTDLGRLATLCEPMTCSTLG